MQAFKPESIPSDTSCPSDASVLSDTIVPSNARVFRRIQLVLVTLVLYIFMYNSIHVTEFHSLKQFLPLTIPSRGGEGARL